jgi:hypothetical protein
MASRGEMIFLVRKLLRVTIINAMMIPIRNMILMAYQKRSAAAGLSVRALYKRDATSKIASMTRIRQKTPTKRIFFTLFFPLLEGSDPIILS